MNRLKKVEWTVGRSVGHESSRLAGSVKGSVCVKSTLTHGPLSELLQIANVCLESPSFWVSG